MNFKKKMNLFVAAFIVACLAVALGSQLSDAILVETAAAASPQTVATYFPGGGITAVAVSGTSTASGTVNITCQGATCPAGIYRLSGFAVVTTANTTETSPNLSMTFGFTDAVGAATSAPYVDATAANTLSTGSTGRGAWSTTVRTTGALTYAVALSGTVGQVFNYDIVSERIR